MAERIGFLVSHPIQYYAPIFRELARRCDLTVFFAHRQTPEQQARLRAIVDEHTRFVARTLRTAGVQPADLDDPGRPYCRLPV